jgi:hypothetical protein
MGLRLLHGLQRAARATQLESDASGLAARQGVGSLKLPARGRGVQQPGLRAHGPRGRLPSTTSACGAHGTLAGARHGRRTQRDNAIAPDGLRSGSATRPERAIRPP